MADWNPFNYLGNLAAHPLVGFADVASQTPIPWLKDWGENVATSDWGQNVMDWGEEHPVGALAGDILGFAVPGSLVTRGLVRASPLFRQAIFRGSMFGGRNRLMNYALGQAVRWSPFTAGAIAFDALGDQYDNAGQALQAFALGTGLGVGIDSVGYALSNAVTRGAAKRIGHEFAADGRRLRSPTFGEVVTSIFRPTVEEEALFGLGAEARKAAEVEKYVNFFDPGNPVQLNLRTLYQAQDEMANGARTDLDSGILTKAREELELDVTRETLPADQTYVNFDIATTPRAIRKFVERGFRNLGERDSRRVSMLAYGGEGPNSWTAVRNELKLPERSIGYMRFPRVREESRQQAAQYFERIFGLTPSGLNPHARRVGREITPTVDPMKPPPLQEWGIFQERDGMWVVTGRLGWTEKGGYRYFQFKTDRPDYFFADESWRRSLDDPVVGLAPESLGPKAWTAHFDVPEGNVSPLFDEGRKIQNTILNEENFRALYRGNPRAKRQVLERLMGSTEVPGLNVGRFVRDYLTPTRTQFRNVPEASLRYDVARMWHDMAMVRARSIVYGVDSLDPEKDILAGAFGKAATTGGLAPQLRGLIDTEERLRQLVIHGMRRMSKLEDIPDANVREAVRLMREESKRFATQEHNPAMKAIDRPDLFLRFRESHLGISHSFRAKGSNHFAVEDANGNLIGMGSGFSASAARDDAEALIRNLNQEEVELGKPVGNYRVSYHFTDEDFGPLPANAKRQLLYGSFLDERSGLHGYKYEFDFPRTVDEFIEELGNSYAYRYRHLAQHLSDAMTSPLDAKLLRTYPDVKGLVDQRLTQLFVGANEGPIAKFQNRVVDSVFGPVWGVNGATKLVGAINQYNGMMTLGMGNVGYGVLNTLQPLQNALPEMTAVMSMDMAALAKWGYVLPMAGKDGLPNGGMWALAHGPGIMAGAFGILKHPENYLPGRAGLVREVFNRLEKEGDLGFRQLEEYIGEDRRIIGRLTDAVRSPEDFWRWLQAVSNWMPAQAEKFSRVYTAAMSLETLKRMGRLRGIEIDEDTAYLWAKNALARTAYRYGPSDRPMVFTTPAGTLFGQFKNWYVNYLNQWADYTGLAAKGNFAPLLTLTAVPAVLGGALAVPVLAQGLDWTTETFADKDAMQFMYEQMGEGATPLAFGITGMLGLGMTGQISAPGANFNHDASFLFGVAAIERMKAMGRALGTAYDQAMIVGQNPFADPRFTQQLLQGFGPRSLYRTYDALVDGALTSPVTGMDRVELSPVEGLLEVLGFRGTNAAVQYEIFDRLMRDKEAMRANVALFGEAYFRASVNQDREAMQEILNSAVARGLDVSAVMRSASRRATLNGTDMFGRSFTQEQIDRYGRVLELYGPE